VSIVDRATAITRRPNVTWPVIAGEPGPAAAIFTGYVAPLAAIGPIASAIGLSVIGVGMGVFGRYREPLVTAIISAVVTYVMILIGVAILTAIASALAPTFGGRKDSLAALKLVGYSYTPAFLAGILSLIPQLAGLEILAALWTLYVFYLGAPTLLLCTKEKALPYTGMCVVCMIVIGVVVGGVIGALSYAGIGFGGPRLGLGATQNQAAAVAAVTSAIAADAAANAASTQTTSTTTQTADAPNAQTTSDPGQAASQVVSSLGSLVSGGKPPVKPISSDDLKTLLPTTAGGLSLATSDGTATTIAGISGTSAQATYGTTSDAKIDLAVGDLGNASGIAALANLGASMDVQSNSDQGYEKNVQVNGQQVHEKWSAPDKESELLEVVNNRYAVTVTGHGVDMDTALAALQSVDMTKFQALGAASH
jgi:Yip1 domain